MLRGRGAVDLSSSDLAALRKMGADFSPAPTGCQDPLTRSVSAYAALIKTALTTEAMARILGVSGQRVRQLLQDRQLYGICPENVWLIPSFQVHDGALLPRLSAVVSQISPKAHPLAVENFFFNSNEDLIDERGTALSPREWLLVGGDPAPLAMMAGDL